ncbi:MAG TPA: hypothetical protein VN258_07535 [Mobilitalea sp.]|nr:hypothetical protein [Mobilitalea sp.]
MGLFDLYNKGATTARVPVSQPNMSATQTIQVAPYSFRLNKTRADVKQTRRKIDEMIGKRDLLNKQLEDAKAEKELAEKDLATFDKVLIILQKTSEFAREQIKGKIEEIVSQALNVVFGGNHHFIIKLDVRAGQPVADYFLDEGGVITQLKKPDYDRGGGKIDVIALSMKLAIGEIEQTPGPIFLDEVGKHVSAEYRPNVAYFLKQYSEQFGRQIILITHAQELAQIGDISIFVSQNNKKESVVKGGIAL